MWLYSDYGQIGFAGTQMSCHILCKDEAVSLSPLSVDESPAERDKKGCEFLQER